MLDPDFRVAAMTGAGVSAESGIATFRGLGGHWENARPEELATPQAFAADHLKVWRFYEARRVQCANCSPNPAHLGLARLEEALCDRFTLITQNVDGLHAMAGSRRILELHGNIWRVRCLECGEEVEDRTAPFPELPPMCGCGGMLRPAVVWFGESLPGEIFESAFQEAAASSIFLVAGTSAVVEPAAGLARIAASHGAKVWEVNPEETPLSYICEKTWRAPAGEVMDEVVDLILSKCQD